MSLTCSFRHKLVVENNIYIPDEVLHDRGLNFNFEKGCTWTYFYILWTEANGKEIKKDERKYSAVNTFSIKQVLNASSKSCLFVKYFNSYSAQKTDTMKGWNCYLYLQ